MYLLGFDIGSSFIKAAIVEAQSRRVVAVQSWPDTEMEMISRQSGWAEQSPEIWWQNICTLTRRIISESGISANDIKAIGLAYQMHGLVLVDENQQVLRPAIIWCDSRAVEIGKDAFQAMGEVNCLRTLLNSPGNFTASKLKWVKDNEPEIYRRIHKVMLPGDYIAMRLTGQICTTVTGLSEGIFWDFIENKVSGAILDHFGIDEHILPNIVPVFSNQGYLTHKAAEMLGLHTGVQVAYRAGDQPNNALALNVIRPGEIAATCGTSGVVYGVFDKPIFDAQTRINAFAHVNHSPETPRIGALLCINGAGIGHGWVKNQIARDGISYQDMERMATSVPVGADGLTMLPFGNGAERIFNGQNPNAHIFNLQYNRHTRAHLYRASIEGVAFSMVHGINILKEMGLQVDLLRVSNDNMFQSRVFCNTIATLLDLQIEMMDTTGATGAAKAAGFSIGAYQTLEEAFDGIQPVEVFESVFNRGHCLQAYSYWSSSLEGVLSRPVGKKTKSSEMPLSKVTENVGQLHTLALKLSAKEELLNQVQQQLESLQKLEHPKSLKAELQKITRRIAESEQQNAVWNQIEARSQVLHNPWTARLHALYPSLNLDDLKLCEMLKLRLSSKELATFFNISVRGVETRRYRLRRKLAMDTESDMIDFLNKL